MESDENSDDKGQVCRVCLQVFDDNARRPRNLPCDHTICTNCIADNLKDDFLLCPICSTGHQATSPEDFPVNEEMETMIQNQENTSDEDPLVMANGEKQDPSDDPSEGHEKAEDPLTSDMNKSSLSIKADNQEEGEAGTEEEAEAEEEEEAEAEKAAAGDPDPVQEETLVPPPTPGNDDSSNETSDPSRNISKKLNSMKEDLANSMEGIKTRSREVTSQLQQYQSLMKEWKEEHEQFIEEYLTIVHEHEELVKYISEEQEKVSKSMKTGEEEMEKLKTAENKLNAASTAQETVPAFGEAAQCYDVVDVWTQEAQKNFPEVKLITKSVTLKERSQNVLKVLSASKKQEVITTTKSKALKRNKLPRSSSSSSATDTSSEYNRVNESSEEISLYSPVLSVQEKVARALHSASSLSSSSDTGSDSSRFQRQTSSQGVQTKMGPLITIHTLRQMSPIVSQVVEAGRVFAVQEHKRQKRYASLSLHKGNLCLHALCKQSLPEDAFVLQHHEVMSLVDPSSRVAFLTLGAGKTLLGRIYIRLSPETNRAHNFALLCTGELGHSYANTNIIRVVDRGKNGEYIDCGDYENNNGTGGKGLVVGAGNEWGGVYKRPCVAGAVDGWWGAGDAKAAQFGITTRDDPGCSLPAAFGMVEAGLHVLKEAIELYPTIRNVKIVDCGIVIPY